MNPEVMEKADTLTEVVKFSKKDGPSAGMVDIAEKVRQIVADQLKMPIENVMPESRFDKDLGTDSLDTVELVIAFEDTFELQIPDIDSERMKKVGDVVKYLEKRLREKQEP